VTNVEADGPPPGDCVLFDATRLAETGALAVAEDLSLWGARQAAGQRLWNQPARRAWDRDAAPETSETVTALK
jgi:hypothetical protein